MSFRIERNDITKIQCDAIVNAANSSLLGGGGVDGAIHRAAGKGLWLECLKLHGCKTGQAKVTAGYKLPCQYVIHTVGPVWRGGNQGEKELLQSCYRESLRLAKEKDCKSIAFPLISSGIYGYPKEKALEVAVEEIKAFLKENEMEVILVVFDKSSFIISQSIVDSINEYIDENYVGEHYDERRLQMPVQSNFRAKENISYSMPQSAVLEERSFSEMNFSEKSLEEAVSMIDESFSEMLLRKIDEKGIKDSECYKKANVDRKLFSKIRGDRLYKPSKQTAIAFIIALELPLNEANEMLLKAGFALSHSSKFDIIIEFFIKKGIYDIFVINEALFSFDQKLLGV